MKHPKFSSLFRFHCRQLGFGQSKYDYPKILDRIFPLGIEASQVMGNILQEEFFRKYRPH